MEAQGKLKSSAGTSDFNFPERLSAANRDLYDKDSPGRYLLVINQYPDRSQGANENDAYEPDQTLHPSLPDGFPSVRIDRCFP